MSLATSLMKGFNAVSCWKRTEEMRTSTPAATSAAVTAVAPVSAARPLRDSGPREFAARTSCPDARSLRTSVPPIFPAPTIPIFIDTPASSRFAFFPFRGAPCHPSPRDTGTPAGRLGDPSRRAVGLASRRGQVAAGTAGVGELLRLLGRTVHAGTSGGGLRDDGCTG